MRPCSAVLTTLLVLLALSAGACTDGAPPGAGAGDDVDAGEDPRERVVAFVDGRVFDGTGSPVLEAGVVLVRGGVISAVGEEGEVDVPPEAEVVDLEGRFLMPGIINAHGHVNPGGDRSDIGEQLDIYAHYGVTTVLSLGDEADAPRDERWSPELGRTRLFVSGPSLNPASPEEAEAEVARVQEMGADWVKMHVNPARGRETYPEVIAAARDRLLPVAVHIEELADAKGVLEAGAGLLAHSVRDRPVDAELIEAMLEEEVCLTPTLTRELSTFVYAERPEFFDDPFFLERSAPEDLDAFLTPERRAQAESPGAQRWREALPVAEENLLRLHEAGAGIAPGTDSGPAGRFQGYFEHLEMWMMADAGMEPEAVLAAATGEAARCLGFEGVLGTVEPGVWADFLVLEEDPTEDIRRTRKIHGVWIAGNRVR